MSDPQCAIVSRIAQVRIILHIHLNFAVIDPTYSKSKLIFIVCIIYRDGWMDGWMDHHRGWVIMGGWVDGWIDSLR